MVVHPVAKVNSSQFQWHLVEKKRQEEETNGCAHDEARICFEQKVFCE